MSVKTQVKVKVVPNSKKAKVEQTEGGVLRVNVDAPAKEGKANKRLVEYWRNTSQSRNHQSGLSKVGLLKIRW